MSAVDVGKLRAALDSVDDSACRCDKAYTTRGLKDPGCNCDTADDVAVLRAHFDALPALLDALAASERGGWVACRERLPEVGDTVIATCGKWVEPAWVNGHGHWFIATQDEPDEWLGVTHWQPLPPPPAAMPQESNHE